MKSKPAWWDLWDVARRLRERHPLLTDKVQDGYEDVCPETSDFLDGLGYAVLQNGSFLRIMEARLQNLKIKMGIRFHPESNRAAGF